jgi:hypothetical protein
MAFFQNVFDQEFQGYLLLADRKLVPTFKIGPNKNLQSRQVAWNAGPYDFSADGELQFNFAWDAEFKDWVSVSIDVSGADPSATTPVEVAAALNADPMFSSMLVASVTSMPAGESVLLDRSSSKRQNFRFYFDNAGAEVALGFNKMAPVAELPEYFARHAVSNVKSYEDSMGAIVLLDESDPVDQGVIENAGFDPAAMSADWQLLRGRSSGLFTFQKSTLDGSGRVTEKVEYPAGALPGDFAKKTKYVYSGAGSNPVEVTEIPHILTSGDLVTP